jgi:quinol-cytochrome oxidoreductase complex cytochrome b subunit
MTETDHNTQDSIPFYPDHVTTEVKVTIGILVVVVLIGILGMITPVGLGAPADPLDTPLHVKPEWYFLALYQLLKFIPKTAGALAMPVAFLLILVWPFIDRKADKSPKAQRTRLIFTVIGMIILIALTIWGEVS